MQVAAPPPGLSAKALKVLGVSAEEVGGAVSPKALKVLGASAEEVLDRATAQPHKLAGHAPSTETHRLAASSSAPSLATRVPRLTITPGDGTAGAQVFVEATRRLRSVSSFPRRPPAGSAGGYRCRDTGCATQGQASALHRLLPSPDAHHAHRCTIGRSAEQMVSQCGQVRSANGGSGGAGGTLGHGVAAAGEEEPQAKPAKGARITD